MSGFLNAMRLPMRRLLSVRSMSSTKKPFDKILVANRGEIACRVLRSAKQMGIKTVAIFSEPDRHAKHVAMADEAVCVGPAASAESYLVIPNVIDACKQTGAQAVHPGYGFLSENDVFCNELEKEKIVFIGPKVEAMHLMGLKIESKEVARKAGVNVIPGGLNPVEMDTLLEECNEIGYPVMVKASAGGGGKGMRCVYNDEEAKAGFRYSKSEAKASFANDTILVEKFIEDPRHVEFQVLADSFGNAVYLNERECSIQRRNQKVIEEAPCPIMDPELRKRMGEQACQLAKAVNYQSAGTVEFLVDKHKDFYFLEMNTRLQVEHPITEYITGVDLVEHMIRIAAGEKLSLKQSDIGLKGWAIESRVYAEDPHRDFLPSIGWLHKYIEPVGQRLTEEYLEYSKNGIEYDVRCDSGILEGSEISMYYDPMISKLCSYGATRDEALAKMREALDSYVIRGVTHNIPFLRALVDHPRFISGDITTNFIAEEYPDGFKRDPWSAEQADAFVGCTMAVHAAHALRNTAITGQNRSFHRDWRMQANLNEVLVTIGDDTFKVDLLEGTGDSESGLGMELEVSKNDEAPRKLIVETDYEKGDAFANVIVNGVNHITQPLGSSPFKYHLQFLGSDYEAQVRTPEEDALLQLMPEIIVPDTSKCVLSPMPGAIFSVNVAPGDTVVPGQEVCIIEAMKMQNGLRSEVDGVVKSVNVKLGDTVGSDEVLIEFE